MNLPSFAFPHARIAVIGCPGSGKSTFARRLRDLTGLPLYHLDAIYWKPDRTTLPREEFYPLMQEIIARDKWIIDGNYQSTMDWRVEACDAVVFLDYATEVCVEGVRRRKGQLRSDMPWIETETDEEFLDYVRRFREEQRPAGLDLLQKHPQKAIFTFTTRTEAETFLENAAKTK